MARHVAFLRAINVGGNRLVAMEQLRKSFAKLGFKDVETFIASGNVVFSSASRDHLKLARQIETQLEADLGFDVDTFVRTTEEVVAIAKYQPFAAKAIGAAAGFNVGFLSEPLPPASCKALEAMGTGIDAFHANGREWYWLCREKQSNSKVSNGAIEKALKVRSTLRGMNTIVRLAAKVTGQ